MSKKTRYKLQVVKETTPNLSKEERCRRVEAFIDALYHNEPSYIRCKVDPNDNNLIHLFRR